MGAAIGRTAAEPDETTPCLAAESAAPGFLSRNVLQKHSPKAGPIGEAASAATTTERAAYVRAVTSTTLVLVANALERTTYFALTTSLVYFLTRTPLCWSDQQAATAGLLFAAVSFAMCALGGLLADCAASRFGAAAAGYVLYVVPHIFLVVLGKDIDGFEDIVEPERHEHAVACNSTSSPLSMAFGGNASITEVCGSNEPMCVLWLALIGVALAVAQGIVHTNLVTFGADQVRRFGAELTRCYFSLLYWTRNVGAIVAVVCLSYIQIGDDGILYTYGSSMVCLFFSAVAFVTGFKYYVRHKPNRSDIKKFLKVLPNALRQKRLSTGKQWPNGTPDSILEYAKVYYGGPHHDKTVEEVKTAGRMLVVFVLLISYSIGFTELVNSFAVQGLHMKVPGSSRPPIAPGIFLVFDSLSVLITLPFLNHVVYPFLGQRGYRITLHMRISVGMLFAALSFIAAGINEACRLNSLTLGPVPQTIGHTIYDAAPMSVFWQIPQYVLLGISEAFVRVTAMEYTYLLAPKAMRSIMLGFLLALPSIGPFVSSALQNLYANKLGWSNINDGQVDYAYYVLAVIQLIGSLAFYAIGRWWPLGLDLSTIVTTRRLPAQLLND